MKPLEPALSELLAPANEVKTYNEVLTTMSSIYDLRASENLESPMEFVNPRFSPLSKCSQDTIDASVALINNWRGNANAINELKNKKQFLEDVC